MSEENAQNPPPKSKTRFTSLFDETTKFYKKHYKSLLILFLIPVVIQAVSTLLLSNILITNNFPGTISNTPVNLMNIPMLIGIYAVFIIVFSLLIMMASGASVRIMAADDKQQKISIMEAINGFWQRFGKALGLSVRFLNYTFGWFLFLFIFVFILQGISLALIKNGDDTVNNFLQPVSPILPILPLIFIAFLIVFFVRMLRAFFSFPILMSGDGSSKEALDESITISKGITGRIFWNLFLVSLVLGILGGMATQLIMQIIALFYPMPTGFGVNTLNYYNSIAPFAGILTQLVIQSFTVTFNYVFMKRAREEKGIPMVSAPASANNGPMLK